VSEGTKRLIGVGVGPGDPELVTVKAIRVLREADVVLVPVLDAQPEPGRAESVISEYVDASKIQRLNFALNDRGGLTVRRTSAWQQAAQAVADAFAAGKSTVTFGTIGDPSLYSTFSYLAQTVRDTVPGVTVEVVPGITAMQDLAARAGVSLAEGTEPVTLVPLNGGSGTFDAALEHGGAVVGYKLGAAASPSLDDLRDLLAADGRLGGAIVGARLGLPGEFVAPLESLEAAEVPYLSTLIVPAVRPLATGSALAEEGSSGKLAALVALATQTANCSGENGSAGAGGGSVTFVGAGPGAPDLLTFRAAKSIAEADIVIWASSLVHPDVLNHAKPTAEIIDSAQLPMEGVLPYYERAAADGLAVARVHSGDPSLWGAVAEQLEQCEALGLDTKIIPGVSSFTAVAAAIGRELTIPEVAQSVILTRLGGGKTPMPPGEKVAEFAKHGTTMALFLSAARSGQLQDELVQGGYPEETPCVVAYQVTWPDELIVHCRLADLEATIKSRKLWKHTLVLVGPGLAAGGTRSHLYHPGHFHGFRRAEKNARRQLRGSRGDREPR
jgi:precorrin-4/cobalt-precorrin-4 C11-methyltransferase